LPNEKVEAQLISLAPGKKSWFAQTLKVINSSKFRRNSPCAFFKNDGCGGCNWMHTSASYQRQLKIEVLIEQLERLGKITHAREICRMNDVDPEEKNWRSKIRLIANDKGELGFRKFRSKEIQVIEKCLIADEAINKTLIALGKQTPGIEVELVKNNDEVLIFGQDDRKIKVNRKVNEENYEANGSGFWQVHPKAVEVLTDTIEKEIKKMAIGSFLDLYSGVGVFSSVILKSFPNASGYAIESDKEASESAKKNLRDFKKVKVLKQKVENWIFKSREKFDLIVLDPPRSGAGVKVMQSICKKAKEKIIYIACDPASLARDTAVAKENGWLLEKVEVYDFFPMTHHFESVAVFTRG
ncbi:MAG: class I SAM-dependent RNA methyltransferase, partial [Actinomycetes bacterium]